MTKLTRTVQGGTLEDFYLEAQGIGFDKSVGTRLHTLTFRELSPGSLGEIGVSAWHNGYTVRYFLRPGDTFWSPAPIVEGITESVTEVAEMIVRAFTRAFHTPDPAAKRRAMLEWAMSEHPPRPDHPPAPKEFRPVRIVLQRIPSQQPESVQTFYQRLQDSHPRFAREGASMLAFIAYVETHQVKLSRWVYIQEHDLVFTNVPEEQPGVSIQPFLERYSVRYLLAPSDAPWPQAYIVSHTNSLEEAVSMMEAGLNYLYLDTAL